MLNDGNVPQNGLQLDDKAQTAKAAPPRKKAAPNGRPFSNWLTSSLQFFRNLRELQLNRRRAAEDRDRDL